MIAGVEPRPVREVAAPRAPPPQAVPGKSLQASGGSPPQPAAAPPPPDLSRSVEVLEQYLANSARTLQFRRDPDAGRTIILVVDPNTGEVLRQNPPKERLALAHWIAPPRTTVIDVRA